MINRLFLPINLGHPGRYKSTIRIPEVYPKATLKKKLFSVPLFHSNTGFSSKIRDACLKILSPIAEKLKMIVMLQALIRDLPLPKAELNTRNATKRPPLSFFGVQLDLVEKK